MTSTFPQEAAEPAMPDSGEPPILLLFTGRTNGRGRRLEGFVAHVLQRRHNHGSFRVRHVHVEDRPDLFDRFRVEVVPSILVIEGQRIVRRLTGFVTPPELEEALAQWLR